MEKLAELSHLFVTVFLSSFASLMVIPAITDVTMSAVCPGKDECSLAIYLSGFQQAVYHRIGDGGDDAADRKSIRPVWKESSAHTSL
ncbi:hypothetical protein OIU78_001278 [Salix suchowensis]|nr:hypothetical protein OIU78_001278 [Salix suchowensis]